MTFRPIKPSPGRKPEDVNVSIAKHTGRARRIRITFHPDLCQKMRWVDATLVEMLIGEGSDYGMIRFKPATVKGFRLRSGPRGDRLVVYAPATKDAPDFWRAGAAEYGINPAEQSLTIRLPWAQKLRAVG